MGSDISRLRTSKQAFVFRSEFRTAVGPIQFIPILIFSSWIFKKGAKNHAESFFFLGHSAKKLKPNLASILDPDMRGQRTLTQPFVSFRSPPRCGPKTEAIFGFSLGQGEGCIFRYKFGRFFNLFGLWPKCSGFAVSTLLACLLEKTSPHTRRTAAEVMGRRCRRRRDPPG